MLASTWQVSIGTLLRESRKSGRGSLSLQKWPTLASGKSPLFPGLLKLGPCKHGMTEETEACELLLVS